MKELFFPTRGYTEKELKEAKPTTRQIIAGTPKAVAEFSANVGNLLGSSPNSLAAKVANTRIGGKLADVGARIEEFGKPRNVEEAAAMRVFDIVSAVPAGSIKVSTTGARAISRTKNLKTIFNVLRKEVPELTDEQADVIGRLLTNVDNEDEVQRVLNGLNFGIQESRKAGQAVPPASLELPAPRPGSRSPAPIPRSTEIKQRIGIESAPPAAAKPPAGAIPAVAPGARISSQEPRSIPEAPIPREAPRTIQESQGARPNEKQDVVADVLKAREADLRERGFYDPTGESSLAKPATPAAEIKDTVSDTLKDVSDTSRTGGVREEALDDSVISQVREYKSEKDFEKALKPSTWGDYETIEVDIPIDLIRGAEPTDAAKTVTEAGRRITEPVEVVVNLHPSAVAENGRYVLLDGNHRIQQARLNGETTIRARLGLSRDYIDDEGEQLINDDAPESLLDLYRRIARGDVASAPSPTPPKTPPPTKKAPKSDTPAAGEGRGGVSEDDSFSLLAAQEEGSEFALRASAKQEERIVSDLEAVFADLKGVDVEDVKLRFAEEDLERAQLDYEFLMGSLIDDPARQLVKYRSKSTGRLPEVTGKDTMKSLTGSGKEVKNSEFGKRGDQILQEIFGYERQVTSREAQEFLDAYLERRNRLDDILKRMRTIRENIRLAKRKDEFVGAARRALANDAAKNVKDLRALTEAAERAGFKRGLEAGSRRYYDLVTRMRGRRSKINAIQKAHNLTDTEMKKIRGPQDPRWMDDAEFSDYLSELTKKAEYEQGRMEERVIIEALISEKNLKKTENLQRAMELPPVKDMSLEELKQFSDALAETAPDSTFLGPRMIQTAVNTDLGNIRTMEEGIKKVIEKTGMKFEGLVEGSELQQWMRDPMLTERDPLHRTFITEWVAKEAEMLTRKVVLQREISTLAKAARRSRIARNAELRKAGELKQGIRERVFDRLTPKDSLIVKWLQPFETTWDDAGRRTVVRVPEIRVGAERLMTPEELKYAQFLENFFSHYYSLAQQESLERWTLRGVKHSNYKDIYFAHMNRSFFERWRDDGFIKALRIAWSRNVADTKIDFNAFGDRGEVLGYEKWLNRSMTREGEGVDKLTGSVMYTQNTAKVALAYFHAFERKLIIDSLTPKIKLLEFLLGKRFQTPKSITNPDGASQVHRTLSYQINQWINNKKGQRIQLVYKQGSSAEAVVDTGSMLVSLLDLGGNITTQMASGVGGEVFNLRGMTFLGWARGHKRALTRQGRLLGRTHAGVIGETPWDNLANAANDAGDVIRSGLFYLFGDLSYRSRRQMFLGLLSPEEFKTGSISAERLAQIKLYIGKFHAMPEFRSVVGSTSLLKAAGKYTEWATPMFQTAVRDLATLRTDLRRVAGDESKLKALVESEGFRNTWKTILVGIGAFVAGKIIFSPDEDDDSFMGRLRRKAAREAGSVIQAASGGGLFFNVRMLGFVHDLSDAVLLLLLFERYETYGPGHKPGDLKFPGAFRRVLTPNFIDQFIPEPETPLKTEEDLKEEIRMALDAGLVDVSAAKKKYIDGLESIAAAQKRRRFKMGEDAYKAELRGLLEREEITVEDAKAEFIEYLEEQKKYAPESFEGTDEAGFIEKIQLVAKGMAVDPVTAFEVIFTGEEIRRIDNGTIIVHRGKTPDEQGQREFSLEERKERSATKDLILDHTVPLQLGGTNRDGNLKLVEREKWEEYTPVENFLGRALREDRIGEREAQRLIKDLKAGTITAAEVYAAVR